MATNNLVEHETEVANAIRAVKGTTGKISPQNFAQEIMSISGSGTITQEHAGLDAGDTLQLFSTGDKSGLCVIDFTLNFSMGSDYGADDVALILKDNNGHTFDAAHNIAVVGYTYGHIIISVIGSTISITSYQAQDTTIFNSQHVTWTGSGVSVTLSAPTGNDVSSANAELYYTLAKG